MKFFFIWFSIFIYTYNSAQISIQGNISDTSNTPLAGVRVMIRDLSSGISKYTSTDSIGFYKIVLPPTKISFLEVQFISYKTYTAYVNSSTSQTLETIRLQSDATLLKEITIEGIQQRGTQKGDTTVFNADAFKVNTDASVQDLVRKMPGVTLENNQVKVNGETVQKVLLDGKPFLGDDANAALRQLPAEIVDKVEFFDKQSDQAAFTGFNDGDPLKTINLISRKNKNKGIFGKSNLAAGPEASDAIKSENLRYHSALNYNNFKNSSRITLLGLANNVNQQNFTASDLGGIGNTGNSRSNGSGRSDNASGFNINPLNGIVETQALGSNYSYQNASVQLSASYFFNAGSTLNKSQLLRQFYTNSQRYSETQEQTTRQNTHRNTLRVEWTIDSAHKLIFTPSFNYQFQQYNAALTSTNQLLDVISQNTTQTQVKPLSFDFNPQLLWQYKLPKKGRTVSFQMNGVLNERLQSGYYISDLWLTDSITRINQRYGTYVNTQRYNAQIQYTEPFGKFLQWQISYYPGLSKSSLDKNYYNFTEHSSTFNSALSNACIYTVLQQKAGIGLNLQYKTLSASFSADALQNQINAVANGDNTTTIKLNYFNVLPNLQLNYKIDKTRNVRLYYRNTTTLPGIQQLQPVLDISNINQVKSGNPSLQQSVDHSLSFRVGGYSSASARNIMWYFRSGWSTNYITSSTFNTIQDSLIFGVRLPKNTSLTLPINMNGYWNARTYITYGFPVQKIKSNINVNGGIVLGSTPSQLRGIANNSQNQSFNLGLVWSSNISSQIDIQAQYNTSYNRIINSITKDPTTYFNEAVFAKMHFEILKRIVLEIESQYNRYSGLSSEFNQDYWLLNTSLGFRCLEQKNLEIRCYVFDLLNANTSISRIIQNNYWDDQQSLTLNRYFQFGLYYTFRKFNGKPKSLNEEEVTPPHFLPPGMRTPR